MNETRDQRGKYTKKASALVALILILSLCTVVRVESAPLLWSPDHILPANSSNRIDQASSIIQTSDGKIWTVWEKEVWDGHAIYYSMSSDYGLTWTSAKNLTNVPNFDINTDPSVVQLSNGTIMVAWSSWRPPPTPPPTVGFNVEAYPSELSIHAGSSANTTIKVTSFNNFSDIVELSYMIFDSDGNITASFNPTHVTPPPNGNANSTMTITVNLIAPLQDYFIQVKGMCPLIGWSDMTTVTVAVTRALALSSDFPSSVYTDDSVTPDANQNYTLYYKTSNDLGATWSKEHLVPLTSNLGDNLSPSIVQAASGTIWLAWTSTRVDPSNSEIFYKTSNGITWSDDVRLTFNAAVNASTDARPAIAQMQDGRIWVAWHSNRYGEYQEIVYNIYNGTAWAVPLTSAIRLTSNTLEDTSAAILQSQDGVIRVFWSSCDMELESSHDIYYVESTNNGVSWSNPPILFPTDSPEDMYPSVAQSVDSRIWVMRTTNETGGWDLYFKTSLVHNVAVKKIAPSQVRVYQQEIVNVNVTVENQGDYSETSIVVSLYANITYLDSKTIALNSRASTIVAFAWNTFGFARGNYTMKAEANAVAGEVYMGDNVRTEGDVAVKLLGDVDDNRLVEVRDLWAVGKAYGSILGSPSWNEEADLNGDNAVNMTDVSSLSGNFGSAG
jgi:hypothetical protein